MYFHMHILGSCKNDQICAQQTVHVGQHWHQYWCWEDVKERSPQYFHFQIEKNTHYIEIKRQLDAGLITNEEAD